MTLDVAGVLRDAWTMAKRDREVLIAVAGLFIFVPQLIVLLMVTASPVLPTTLDPNPAAQQALLAQMQAWMTANLPYLLTAAIVILTANIALLSLYVDRARPTVAQALLHAPLRLIPVLLISLLVSPIAVSMGLVPLLIVPAAYLEGRLLLALPTFLGEQPISAVRAIRSSWQRTKGHGLVCAGLACIGGLAGFILARPFDLLGHAMNSAPLANPVVALMIDGCAALAVAVGAVAKILIEVALYRRLSSGT